MNRLERGNDLRTLDNPARDWSNRWVCTRHVVIYRCSLIPQDILSDAIARECYNIVNAEYILHFE